jgi:hypothetical protein
MRRNSIESHLNYLHGQIITTFVCWLDWVASVMLCAQDNEEVVAFYFCIRIRNRAYMNMS